MNLLVIAASVVWRQKRQGVISLVSRIAFVSVARTFFNAILLSIAFALLLLNTLDAVVEVVLGGSTLLGLLALYKHLISIVFVQSDLSTIWRPSIFVAVVSRHVSWQDRRTFFDGLLGVDNLLLILFLLFFLLFLILSLLGVLSSLFGGLLGSFLSAPPK